MAWTDVLQGALGIAGLGYSIYSGQQAQSTAAQQYDNVNSYNQQQLALANQSAATAADQYNRYKEIWDPIERGQALEAVKDLGRNSEIKDYMYSQTLPKLQQFSAIEDSILADATKGVSKQQYMDQASGDVSQAFSSMRGTNDRSAARMGLNPNSSRFSAMQRDTGVAEALASAGARTNSARAADDASRNMKYTAMNMKQGYGLLPQTQSNGQGVLASSQSAMGQAMGGIGSAAQTAAGLGGIAAQSAASANQTAGYLGTKMMGSTNQGGVDWGGAAGTIKKIFGYKG